MSNETTVYHRGKTNCTSSGKIVGHGNDQRCGKQFNQIEFNVDLGDGDSGGPNYHAPGGSDSLQLLAPHRGGTPADGAAAYEINAIHGWEFGITPQCSR